MSMGNRLAAFDPEEQNKGDARRAALYAPAAAANDFVRPRPSAHEDPLLGLLLHLGAPLRLALRSPGRAALWLLGAAADFADDLVGPPPHPYAAQVWCTLVLVDRSSRLLLRSAGRAGIWVLGAAADFADQVFGPPPHPYAAQVWMTMVLFYRSSRVLLGTLLRFTGPAGVWLLGAAAYTADHLSGTPPHPYAVQVWCILVILHHSARLFFARLHRSPPRVPRWLLGAATIAAAATFLVAALASAPPSVGGHCALRDGQTDGTAPFALSQ